MSDDENHTEYEGWTRPGADAGEGEATDHPDDSPDGPLAAEDEDDDWGPPPTMRDPLLRDRIRDRLGVTARQWYVIEAFLIALPYPFFVAVYLLYPVNETLFLVGTLAYSLVAMYVGFLS